MRRTIAIISAVLLVGATAAGVVWIRSARRDAMRARVYGRLSQLHLVVVNHEYRHGSLPPAFGPDGERRLNWFAFVLREVEEDTVHDAIDFSMPWNSPQNQAAVARSRFLGDWVSLEGYTICPLRDSKSIWNLDTGESRGSSEELPDAILFVAVPLRDIDPLQPYDVDENMLREVVKQNKDVFFVTCSRLYGRVTLQDNRLVYTVPPYLVEGQKDE